MTEGAAARMPGDARPIWSPDAAAIARAELTRFRTFAAGADSTAPRPDAPYHEFWTWSVEQPERFWPLVWRFARVVADEQPGAEPWDAVLVGGERMAPPDRERGPRWFPGARLNFAENLLQGPDDATAVVAWTEAGPGRRLTFAELRREVARAARGLRDEGVGAGDRVAGFVSNGPEAVVAMLATASLGAVWSSCSPDFGVRGVLDRFGQIEPTVLFATTGYRYGGNQIACAERVREIAAAVPGLRRIVLVGPDRGALGDDARGVTYERFLGADDDPPLAFKRLPFDHPLYILYSSGTTGLPKCMVHSAGGTLIQHLKEHVLHTDLRAGSVLFYFTTCGWMMWNWLVSALAVGATIVLYDGSPLSPDRAVLWRMAARERVTTFGTSAKYLALAEKAGVRPDTHDLSALDAVLSTGSPLAPQSYAWVSRAVGERVRLSSISGGTDIVSCFALGNPTAPVYAGELQCRGLGMAVDAWDANGRPVRGEPGELVCTRPFPSMPVAFWNDADGAKYRAAYFEHFAGAWRHGDWIEITEHDGVVIHGRSDATLNPGGVRIGTAEIYRIVEELDDVVESLVIGQDVAGDAGGDVRIVLFVRLAEGRRLDDALRERIRSQVRANASPHHVPRRIVQVADIPRTISGKITELAVRDVVHGRKVANRDALANPQALELFRDLPELRD